VRTLLATLALVASAAARAAEPSAAPSPAAEEKPLPWAWELDAYAGYGQLAWPALQTANVTWSNGGPAFALGVAYRGDHFTHPFIDIAYVPIISSGQYVNSAQVGSGLGVQTFYSSNSSYAIGLAAGPGFDIDWFRARLGLALYDVVVNTNVTGTSNTVTQWSVGFLVSAAALVWRPDPFALGVEARLVALNFPLTGIYQTMWSVGITGRWDFAKSRAGAP
jgi:hypothetical protein